MALITPAGSLGPVALGAASAGQPEATIEFELYPAGDFEAKSSSLIGFPYYQKSEGKKQLKAPEKVLVDMCGFDTGIDLRTRHMRRYLDAKRNPVAVIGKIQGKDGEGTAILAYRGVRKTINFEYELEDGYVEVEFEFRIPDLKIEKAISYKGVGVEDEARLRVRFPIGSAPVAAVEYREFVKKTKEECLKRPQ